MTENELIAYLAGIIDGEGYVGIKRTKAYKCQGRKTPGFSARIQVRMVDEEPIRLLAETLGGWYYPEKPHSRQGRPLFCWQLGHAKAEDALRMLLPYLRVKKRQARKLLTLRRLKKRSARHRTKILGYRNFPNKHGTPRSVPNLALSDEYVGWCQRLWNDCHAMNGGAWFL
jgi:hypothetical protein